MEENWEGTLPQVLDNKGAGNTTQIPSTNKFYLTEHRAQPLTKLPARGTDKNNVALMATAA